MVGPGLIPAPNFLSSMSTRGLRALQSLVRKLVSHFGLPPDRQQYFDEDVARDQWDLLETAALLQITEFRVFELAYREWYGVAAKHRVIEIHFRNYMFNQLIPAWVAHFCRRIVELERTGTLDPKDFGIYPRQPSRRMIRIGQAYTAMLLAAFLVLIYMAYGQEIADLLANREGSNAAGMPQHNIVP